MTNSDQSKQTTTKPKRSSVEVPGPTEVVEKSETAKREEAILTFWQEQKIFQRSLDLPAGRPPKGDYVFYDGPPFATGLPHYGHILVGTIKDVIPRFWTMNGYRVRRQWGWDCHGLPLENLIEKKLGLTTKRDIEAFGIKQFNQEARDSVLQYADDWRRIVPRLGRFVDMENDYKTMNNSYMESVWWVFKQLHEKGLVYEGFKSMHLCPRCGTTLSNFEVNQGYKDIKDIAVTVKLPLLNTENVLSGASILVWTTTPWTLPGNLAVAINRTLTYVVVEVVNEAGEVERLVLAKGRLVQLGDLVSKVIAEIPGSELEGCRYEPPFAYLKGQDFEQSNTWKIYHADYVELGEEGTGAVHIAPAYGEEDLQLAQANNIPIVHHVDYEGRFKGFVTDFAGHKVKPIDDPETGVTHHDSDIAIIKALKANSTLIKKENITHSYPHCWRDGTPLLNYATTSWFVNVTKIKDEIVTANSQVHWVPEHVGENRFGRWLEGARDWAVSRQRYWGAPLPIWRSPKTGAYRVIGSLEEFKERVLKSGNHYFLVRHGESVLNTKNVLNFDRSVDNGMTELGKKQVDELVTDLKQANIDLIYYSPLQRTKETAQQIATALGLPKEALISDERLLEMRFGVYEGSALEEYWRFFGDGLGRMNKRPAGGENWNDVKRRTGDFLYELESAHQEKNILIVSHNGTLQMLQSVANGETVEESGRAIDQDLYDLKNAELRQISFVPLPHNENYELDFHRPYIDTVVLQENDDRLERIPDVFDCWFESGAMPYGQHHYPFEHKDDFEQQLFPAEFIAEALDQTRGWFYSLLVIGVALFKVSPYRNVTVTGMVLAEDGRKMSKSLQNYPDPMDLVARQGADAMRLYLLSSPIVRGEDLNFSEKEVQELQRKTIGRLHNVLQLYELYQTDVPASDDSNNILDRWIIARRHQLVTEVTAGYRQYELDKATRPVTDFIDDLSVWYVRRSRERLKGEDVADRQASLSTLRSTLRTLALVMAPAMPFYAEYLWRAVRSDDDFVSVHLAPWPEPEKVDSGLITAMKQARETVSSALEARVRADLKVRQPISGMTGPLLAPDLQAVVLEEVNAKTYRVVADDQPVTIDTKITPELLAEGEMREFVRAVQQTRKEYNLQPKQSISLWIEDGLERLIAGYTEEVKKTVGCAEIKPLPSTTTEGEDVRVIAVGGKNHQFRISVLK